MSSPAARLTDHFVRHPVLALVVNLVIVLAGVVAWGLLPVRQFPMMVSSSLIVETVYIGASADDIRGFVSTPIERAASEIAGVDYVDSSSAAGMSTVTVHLALDVDSTAPLAELTARLLELESQLPRDAEPPVVRVQRADRPYATFYPSLTSDVLDQTALTSLADQLVQPALATIPGVQRVGIEGARTRAMRVWLDADLMALQGVEPSQVWGAIERNNVVGAIGRSETKSTAMDLVLDATLRSPEDFRQIVVRDEGRAVVRLGDVARVELGAETPAFLAEESDHDAVFLSVWPAARANEIELAHALRARIAELGPKLPAGTTLRLAFDGAAYMEDALFEINETLLETIAIVGLVVFLFLGSFRSALVPLVAIPVSLIGAVALMALMGFSLNLLTILAIVLAVGLVVDDAIVVVEDVERHIQEGRSRIEAARRAAEELAAPVVAMTVTLAAVYAPIAVQGGLTGALFREFSLALAAAVLASGVVALTLAPLLSARLARESTERSWLQRASGAVVGAMAAVYAKLLGWALPQWPFVLASAVVVIGTLPWLVAGSAAELAPTEDQGSITLFYEGAPDSRLEDTYGRLRGLSGKINQLPGVATTWGVGFAGGAFGGVDLGPHRERTVETAELQGHVQGILSQEPGLRALAMLPSALPGAGNFDVELVLTSTDPTARMSAWADQIVGHGWQTGLFAYVDNDTHIDRPTLRWAWDRDALTDQGVDPLALAGELGAGVAGGYVNRFISGERAYKVLVQYAPGDRTSGAQLADRTAQLGEAPPVYLQGASTQTLSAEPRALQHFQQRNAVRVRGAVLPGVSKEAALSALEGFARTILPGDYALDYAGESRQIRQEGTTLFGSMALALVLVYFTLAAQFGSFRDPLVVLMGSVPLALAGALLFTYYGFTTINVYSQVGLVTLVGLVAKNGILIVEFANEAQGRGLDRLDAAQHAAITRFRPILMTTAATIFGHLPLVMVTGAGAAARNSIGIVLVTGMAIGTFFTLFVVPCAYVLLGDNHQPKEAA